MRLLHGDCRTILPTLPDNSVDAVVTDPPAGIGFMGKGWDTHKGRDSFIAFLTNVMHECLRILKPGGHALVWAIPRTSHWTATACEDAGFEIRDKVYHLFGSGFPKSLDVSKAIDKAGGTPPPPHFAEWLRAERERRELSAKELCERGKFYKNVNHGGLVSNWESGIGLPNTDQFNVLCDLLDLPFSKREVVRREILGWRPACPGVAFSSDGPDILPFTAPATDAAKQWDGWGTALKPAAEEWILCRKPLSEPTVAANVLRWGVGAINVDGCRVGTEATSTRISYNHKGNDGWQRPWNQTGEPPEIREHAQIGRWPATVTHDGSPEVLAGFPETVSGTGRIWSNINNTPQYGDTGSAARFFFCAKASRADRGENCGHPTVKATALMRWLCRLITPPAGTILDPFMGSGSTGKAAVLEGFDFIGIEQEAEYIVIAERRIRSVMPLFTADTVVEASLA